MPNEEPQKVKVIEVVGTKLEPDSNYILAIRRGTLEHESMADLQYVIETSFNVKVVVVDFPGDPQTDMRFFSVPRPPIIYAADPTNLTLPVEDSDAN